MGIEAVAEVLDGNMMEARAVARVQAEISFRAGEDAILEELRAIHSLKGFDKMVEAILKPTVVDNKDK